jgi:hypothetical protein
MRPQSSISASKMSTSPITLIIDPTVRQFRTVPDYTKAKGCGFLTKKPSKRAKALMETLVWQ